MTAGVDGRNITSSSWSDPGVAVAKFGQALAAELVHHGGELLLEH